MITNIPDAAEFKNNGIAFLNLAWESLLSMSQHVSAVTAELEEETERQEYEKEYWREARQELGVAVALIQQGAEFLIKGKICELSPFLLLR